VGSRTLHRPAAAASPKPPLAARSMSGRRSLFPVVVLLAVGLQTACAGAKPADQPETTVARFADALEGERLGVAYRMMSDSYRRRVPFEEFERHLRDHPAEARSIVQAVRDRDEETEITADVPLGAGDTLHLVRTDEGWRIHGNVVNFYDQTTPRAALRSFIRAMERRRYDVVMRFVPDADREGMTTEQMRTAWEGEGREEIERLLANLRNHLDNPIEIVGNRATMPYGERFTVQFVREDGVWKIEDPD
jgi:hypothetical protein